MAFPDELLQLAQELGNTRPENPGQATLFHLLISEATLNWNRTEVTERAWPVFMERRSAMNKSKKVKIRRSPEDGRNRGTGRRMLGSARKHPATAVKVTAAFLVVVQFGSCGLPFLLFEQPNNLLDSPDMIGNSGLHCWSCSERHVLPVKGICHHV